MACPLCMKEFTIPDDGISGTQKNFFIEKQIHEKQLSALEEVFKKVSQDKLKVAIRWKTTNEGVDIDSNSRPPKVIHVITKRVGIGGLTSLGDEVFVVPCCGQREIEVYDAETFTLQRRITVPWLGDRSFGLAACPHNNCLYASDRDADIVHRVELSDSNALMKWSVARQPVGLSVNSEHNLLVVGEDPSMLQIFTTDGTLLQSIQLQYIGGPRYAVQLPTGQFLVSQRGSLHRFCLVGVDGAVVSYHGHGRQYRGISPGGIAVDSEGRVLVADLRNNRLLVMDQSLSRAHEMSVCVYGDLTSPECLWYDQPRRRLYIGELASAGGRVIVIDNLKDFSAAQVNA